MGQHVPGGVRKLDLSPNLSQAVQLYVEVVAMIIGPRRILRASSTRPVHHKDGELSLAVGPRLALEANPLAEKSGVTY